MSMWLKSERLLKMEIKEFVQTVGIVEEKTAAAHIWLVKDAIKNIATTELIFDW